jgi:hypothetical protein
MTKKPYTFKPSLEHLRELKDLSPKEKLDWLEEASQFVAAFVSPEKIERWRKITSAQQD